MSFSIRSFISALPFLFAVSTNAFPTRPRGTGSLAARDVELVESGSDGIYVDAHIIAGGSPSTSTSTTTISSTTSTTSSSSSTTSSQVTVSFAVIQSTASATPTASANSTSTSAYSTATSSAAAMPSVLRGVNIGGWLVLEKWMTSDVFDNTNATDQWTFDQTDGAEAALQEHWSTYFTEDDVTTIASWGINAVRIPIGYWAYNNTGTPYISGADAYLEKAIEWCRAAGIKVSVDCHGSPGSQNGFDNSGHAGNVEWQSGDNMDVSISVLETMAAKYGSMDYSDVVFGLELTNEPISWDENDFATTKQWAQDAYAAVVAKAENPDLNIIMHDGFMGPDNWEAVGSAVNGNSSLTDSRFWIDTHLYQNQVASDSELTQEEHIEKACAWSSTELLPASANLPVIVGEFSAQTNICANPDGSTLAGSVCYIDGCQCSSNVDIEYWNEPLINATRMFLEAEMDTFESHARGYFMWTYKGPGAWGYTNAVKYGSIGDKITDRAYPGQCDS